MCNVQYMTQVCREGPLIEVENYQDIIFKLCIFFTLGGDIHKQSHQNLLYLINDPRMFNGTIVDLAKKPYI